MTEKKTFIITTEPITLYMDAESEEDAKRQFEDDKLGFKTIYDDLVIANIEEQASTTYISDKPPTLKESYDIIGCRTVELLHCDDGSQILIDEEGKLTSMENWVFNYEATKHWFANTKRGKDGMYSDNDSIVGNAIILSDKAVWT